MVSKQKRSTLQFLFSCSKNLFLKLGKIYFHYLLRTKFLLFFFFVVGFSKIEIISALIRYYIQNACPNKQIFEFSNIEEDVATLATCPLAFRQSFSRKNMSNSS